MNEGTVITYTISPPQQLLKYTEKSQIDFLKLAASQFYFSEGNVESVFAHKWLEVVL